MNHEDVSSVVYQAIDLINARSVREFSVPPSTFIGPGAIARIGHPTIGRPDRYDLNIGGELLVSYATICIQVICVHVVRARSAVALRIARVLFHWAPGVKSCKFGVNWEYLAVCE